jgi:hypothetical protein
VPVISGEAGEMSRGSDGGSAATVVGAAVGFAGAVETAAGAGGSVLSG